LPTRSPAAERGHPVDELVVDAPLDEKARAGAANLAGIREHRHPGAGNGAFEVRVGEHDVGRLAAEFERHPLEVPGGCRDDLLAGDVRAGEGDLVDAGVGGKRRSRGFAVPGYDVDHAGRHTGLEHQLAEAQRRQRRFLGRLEDNGATRGEGRADLPYRGTERTIPGNDRADDADGFLQGVGENLAGQ
jgi:hypothetical protein